MNTFQKSKYLALAATLTFLSACGQRQTTMSLYKGKPSVFSEPSSELEGQDDESESAVGKKECSDSEKNAEFVGSSLQFYDGRLQILFQEKFLEEKELQKAKTDLENFYAKLRDLHNQKERKLFSREVVFYAYNENDPEAGTNQVSVLLKCGKVAHVSLGYFTTTAELEKRMEEVLQTLKQDLQDQGEEEKTNKQSEAEPLTIQEQVSRLPEWNKILWWPVPSQIFNSEFGYRIHPVTKVRHLHSGSDLKAPYGQIIQAAAQGVVLRSDYYSRCGNRIQVLGGSGTINNYCHLSISFVKPGDLITPMSLIGRVGSSGMVTGPHLHLELKINRELKNPRNFLRARPTKGLAAPRYKEKSLAITRYK